MGTALRDLNSIIAWQWQLAEHFHATEIIDGGLTTLLNLGINY